MQAIKLNLEVDEMKTVLDRIVQYPNRYKLVNAETQEVLGIFDFTEVPGTVQQDGTVLNAELFNEIKNDIFAKYTKPLGGIPEEDLSQGVKNKINNIDLGIFVKNPSIDTIFSTSVTDDIFNQITIGSKIKATVGEYELCFLVSHHPSSNIFYGITYLKSIDKFIAISIDSSQAIIEEMANGGGGDDGSGANIVDLGELTPTSATEFTGTITAENYAKLATPNTVVKCSFIGIYNIYTLLSNMGGVGYFGTSRQLGKATNSNDIVDTTFGVLISPDLSISVTILNQPTIPYPTSSDNGKILGVDSSGNYALQEPSGGTTVVANPTLSGSEAELTGLEVDGKKYKVPQGGSGGGGIVAVDSLPTPNQTEYEKHLLYLQGGELNFIAEKLAEEPTVR